MKIKWLRTKLKSTFWNMEKKRAFRFLIVVVICALIVSAGYYEAFRLMRMTRIDAQKDEIERSATTVEFLLKESIDAIQMAAYTLDGMMSSGASKEEMLEYLEKQTDTFAKSVDEQFDGLYGLIDDTYLDGVGWIPPEGYVAQERPWYTRALEENGKVALVAPYLDAETGRIVISVCCMLPDKKSVVALDQFLDHIQTQIEKEAVKNEWELCMIVDADGYVVAHSDPSLRGVILRNSEDPLYQELATKIPQAEDGPVTISEGGKKYRLYATSIEQDWHIAALVSEKTMLGGLQYFYLLNLFTILAVALVLFLLLYREEKGRYLADDTRRQFLAIANIYSLVYLIDLTQDSYIRIADDNARIEEVVGSQEGAQNTMRAVLDKVTDSRFKPAMFEFSNFATLNERLRGKNKITREFINNNNRRCRSRFVVVERDEEENVKRVIWVLELVDERGGMQLI